MLFLSIATCEWVFNVPVDRWTYIIAYIMWSIQLDVLIAKGLWATCLANAEMGFICLCGTDRWGHSVAWLQREAAERQ